MSTLLPLLAESVRSDLRWHFLPPAWVLALVLLPLVAFASWGAYSRETDVARPARILLATLRGLALAFFLLVLFGPYSELYETRTVRAHFVVLVDQSQSMATIDGYEPEDARKLARAAGIPEGQLASSNRLDLVKRVLSNVDSKMLESWTQDFRLHIFGFGTQTTPIVSTGDSAETDDAPATEEPAAVVRRRLADLSATDPATRIGQAVATVCDAFRLRDEPVAGIVVISDGQDNGTVVTPAQAGRKAAAMHVPVFAVGVGDPRSPRNIHVGNLRAKEVVLAKDDTVFEFTVHAKGFEGRRAKIELAQKDPANNRWRPLPVNPSEVVLEGGDKDQQVKVTHRFMEPGLISIRIGVPVQPEEKIQSDNFVEHTIRVIDRKIKVLYVEAGPRYEYSFLSNALTRDRDTMLAHTLLLDADLDTPQRKSGSPDWPALDASLGLPVREKLFEYDVLILGDADWRNLGPTDEQATAALQNIRDFVDRGGGILLISGVRNNPTRYKDTELQGLLPIVVDRSAERSDPPLDPAVGFNIRLTPEGEQSPLMNLTGDAAESKRMWETDADFRQYWSYPALRAKALAKVLAVSPLAVHEDPRHGPRPLVATMVYGRGRVLWLGIDDLWRLRRDVGDRYFYRFYGEAVRFLATYKLLGGNKRFKILTDRDQYGVDDPVLVTLDVLDRDYEPSKAPSQTVTVQLPPQGGATPETVELTVPADPGTAGTYRKTILPTRPGEYRIKAATDDPQDEAPEKIFRVAESTIEGRDLLLDESRLDEMARNSEGGRYMLLGDLPELKPAPREVLVPTDKRDDEIWDHPWTLTIATLLLASEWLLRKRWHLV